MKTKFYYVLALFCAALTLANLSCVNEVVGTDSESSPVVDPEAIWEYRGESQVVPKVIAELKSNSANKVQMEDRLLNNDVLWEEAVFLLVENKKRILVPVLSYSKSNIIAVLSLVRNKAGKTQWGVTFRWDLAKKNVQLPFWEASRWQGYFEALDAELLGIDNGSPGIMERPIENLKTSGKSALQAKSADWEQHCITYRVEYCYKQALCGPGFENCDYDNAETIYCTYSYEEDCYDVHVGGGDDYPEDGGGNGGSGPGGPAGDPEPEDYGYSYSEYDYPGKDKGFPYEWWKDANFIINSGNFDIDDQTPNVKEAALFAIYVPQAIMHVENSTVALDKAYELANNGTFTPNSIEDGKADAFRHAFWNAMGTAEFGSHIMKLFADAHEWNETGLAVDMDFYNNHKGRLIGGNFSLTSSDGDISNAVLQSINNGNLKYIKNGVLTPSNQ